MLNKKIVYITGDFDPTLCSGVSASFFDLFKYFKTLGYDPYIVSFFPDWVDVLKTKEIIEKMGGSVLFCNDSQINCILDGVSMSCEKLPYSRMEILGNVRPEILKKFIQKIKKFPGAYFFTADIDLTAIIANVIVKTTFAHHVHSPVVFLDVLKDASPMYVSFLKSKNVFVVNATAKEIIKNKLGISSSVWPPFIDLNRFRFKEKCINKKKIGYYSAGSHKGDIIVKKLIESMADYQFFIMGNGSYSFSGYPNALVLGKETDLKGFYTEILLLLVPSLTDEGFPRVILEASVNGIPVIANNVNGTTEALEGSGILISKDLEPAEMVKQYKNTICSLFTDNKLYQQYSGKALLRAEKFMKGNEDLSVFFKGIM